MKNVLFFSLMVPCLALAGFGGSRASPSVSRSYSAPSRPSSVFGGSRATYSAPIVRSAPAPKSAAPSAPRIAPSAPYRQNFNSTQSAPVYHDSTGSFVNGMMMGTILNHGNSPSVVVVPQQGAASIPVDNLKSYSAPSIESKKESRFPWAWFLLGLALIGAACIGYYRTHRERF